MDVVHVPVMLDEVLSFLVPPREGALMVDCTLGEGGHAEAFLSRYPALRYIGLDADPRIQAKARERLATFAPRVEFRLGFFDDILESLLAEAEEGRVARPELVLFDLGISMHHYVEAGRGFGFGKDEALDMRLSPEAPRSAADLVNGEREEELARIIFEYGEERYSRRIAKAIVEARRSGGISTSGRLADVVAGAVPPAYRHGRIHAATRTFQALRISVNDELGRAERGIRRAASLLAPGGIVAVISFHSLEDRIAKNVFRELAGRSTSSQEAPIGKVPDKAILELLTKKPLEATAEEAARNPASRSAKLRAARRIGLAAGKADL
jgi:16S rRNA (cytosine1402-N4)-methyltransferase